MTTTMVTIAVLGSLIGGFTAVEPVDPQLAVFSQEIDQAPGAAQQDFPLVPEFTLSPEPQGGITSCTIYGDNCWLDCMSCCFGDLNNCFQHCDGSDTGCFLQCRLENKQCRASCSHLDPCPI